MHNILNRKLRDLFKERSDISMAFLFGSAATDRQTEESDVDVAVWFANKYNAKDVDQLWLEVERAVKNNVDLIVLNEARPTLAWTAMCGEKLKIADYRLYLNKMLDFSRQAEDFQAFITDLWGLRRKIRGAFA